MPEFPERDIRDPRVGSAGFYGGAPVPVWVTPDELLIIGVRNSKAGLTLQFSGRIWHPDGSVGELNQTIVPGTTRALQFFSFQLYYGFLVHAAVTAATGAGTRGQTLVSLQLARPPASAFATKWFLGQDYVTGMTAVYWPFGRAIPGIEGPGVLRSIAGTVPAAGAEILQTVPTGARWRLVSLRFLLTTSAAVATRQVFGQVDDGVTVLARVPANDTQAAGAARNYNALSGESPLLTGFSESYVDLPPNLWLLAGFRFGTLTSSIQAGDQYSGIQFLVEEWIED